MAHVPPRPVPTPEKLARRGMTGLSSQAFRTVPLLAVGPELHLLHDVGERDEIPNVKSHVVVTGLREDRVSIISKLLESHSHKSGEKKQDGTAGGSSECVQEKMK